MKFVNHLRGFFLPKRYCICSSRCPFMTRTGAPWDRDLVCPIDCVLYRIAHAWHNVKDNGDSESVCQVNVELMVDTQLPKAGSVVGKDTYWYLAHWLRASPPMFSTAVFNWLYIIKVLFPISDAHFRSSEYLQLDIPHWCQAYTGLTTLHPLPCSFILMFSPLNCSPKSETS